MEVRKVYKAGNSYVVSIPKQIMKLLNLKAGDKILFKLQQNQVILTPANNHERIEVIRRIAGCLTEQDEALLELLTNRETEEDREGTVFE